MQISSRERFRKYTDEETFNRIVEYDSVSSMWKHCLAGYSDCIAVVDDGIEYTYKKLEEDAAGFRSILAKEKLSKADRIGILAVNSYDFVKAFLAITTAGMTAMILPPQMDEKTVFGCVMKYGLKALVYDGITAPKTTLAAQKTTVINIAETSSEAAPLSVVAGEDPCVIMFTGGTTGRSKGTLLSNRAVLQGAINGCYGYADVFHQKYILVLPLSHVFGLIRNLMTSLYTGSTLFICRDNKNMFKNIAEFRPTMLVAVPALVEMALRLSKQFGRNMLGEDMKAIICGAANVPPYLVNEYARMGIAVFPGYGLTETANLVCGNPESKEHPDAVGFLYPNQEIRFVDGEIWLKGSNIMDGYLGEEEKSFEDGWFRTGDLGRIDENGLLYITGRIKELIVLDTGENISPAELEAHFNTTVLIQDCQVFEDVLENGRHILALEVVPREYEVKKLEEDPQQTILEELHKLNAQLPTTHQVSRIVVRDSDFERSPSMKIIRYHKCK